MDLNFLQSILYGFSAGLAEILPISARAHSILLLKVFGAGKSNQLFTLLIHIAVLAAIYFSGQTQIVRISRALSLARVPKKKRKRPLDMKSIMDFKLWRIMILPVILMYFLYDNVAAIESNLLIISILIFINGLILYIPQFLPGSNKDSRTLSPLDGLFMGLGGSLSILPGISGIGAAVSVGAVRGAERTYALNIALMMSSIIMVWLIIYDVIAIAATGIGVISVSIILKYIISAVAAFGGACLGITIMRTMAENSGYHYFAFYCWGIAFFTFILNLLA